jgi:hypothetical protein
VIDADRADLNFQLLDTESGRDIGTNGLTRFRAKAANAALGIVTGERRQIHQGDGLEEPGGLPLLLDSAASA